MFRLSGTGTVTVTTRRVYTGSRTVSSTCVIRIRRGSPISGSSSAIRVISRWPETSTTTDATRSASIGRQKTTFYVINKLGANNGGLGPADFSFIFGNPEDKPFVGDFNGDGIDTIGLHRESTGIVYFRQTNTTGVRRRSSSSTANPDDRFVAGDWVIVDGIDTPGCSGLRTPRSSCVTANTQGVGDVSFPFGDSNDLPIAGIWGP